MPELSQHSVNTIVRELRRIPRADRVDRRQGRPDRPMPAMWGRPISNDGAGHYTFAEIRWTGAAWEDVTGGRQVSAYETSGADLEIAEMGDAHQLWPVGGTDGSWVWMFVVPTGGASPVKVGRIAAFDNNNMRMDVNPKDGTFPFAGDSSVDTSKLIGVYGPMHPIAYYLGENLAVGDDILYLAWPTADNPFPGQADRSGWGFMLAPHRRRYVNNQPLSTDTHLRYLNAQGDWDYPRFNDEAI